NKPKGLSEALQSAKLSHDRVRGAMLFLQEELDWQYYEKFGLFDDHVAYANQPFPIQLGERAFEISLARRMANGQSESTCFQYLGIRPMTDLPTAWPQDYQDLVRRRMEVIATNPNIALIEQPEYKRRWNTEPWESQLERALRSWLLDRLESYLDFD